MTASETVEIVCLAFSRKHSAYCMAGLRMDSTGWVRPVGMTDDGALQDRHCRLPDRTYPRPFDVLRIGLYDPRPKPYHPEDWRVDGNPWALVARPLLPEKAAPLIRAALSRGPGLLGTHEYKVHPDEVAALKVPASLTMIQPQDLRWQISLRTDLGREGERRLRALFVFACDDYDLPVTDIQWEAKLAHLPPGDYTNADIGVDPDAELLFTVSLSEPFRDYCYKLVAAVLTVPKGYYTG